MQEQFEAAGQYDPKLIQKAFGFKPTDEQGAIIQAALDEKAEYLSGALCQAFGEQLKELTAIGWTSDTHTSECVDLFTYGPGAEQVPPFVKNYEMFGLMTSTLGITT